MAERSNVADEPTAGQQILSSVESVESFHCATADHNHIADGIPDNCINSLTEFCDPAVENPAQNNTGRLGTAKNDKEFKIDDSENQTDDITDNMVLMTSENTGVDATGCTVNSSATMAVAGSATISVSNYVQDTVEENVNAIIGVSSNEIDRTVDDTVMTGKFEFINF